MNGRNANPSPKPAPLPKFLATSIATKTEAMKQIEAKGYTHVAKLKKDENGVWRGTAMKDGQTGPISVDYQGNVN